jgi:hypothetical protein
MHTPIGLFFSKFAAGPRCSEVEHEQLTRLAGVSSCTSLAESSGFGPSRYSAPPWPPLGGWRLLPPLLPPAAQRLPQQIDDHLALGREALLHPAIGSHLPPQLVRAGEHDPVALGPIDRTNSPRGRAWPPLLGHSSRVSTVTRGDRQRILRAAALADRWAQTSRRPARLHSSGRRA